MTSPTAVTDLDFDDLASDPYPHLARIRPLAEAVWAPKLDMWLVTHHETAVRILRAPEQFTNDSPNSLIQSTFGRQMLSVESDEQRRYKQACLAPFTGRAARETWRARIDELCSRLLDEAEAAAPDTAVDLMTAYAAPIALETMGIVVGLPAQDLAQVRSWYEVFARSLANFEDDRGIHEQGQRAAHAMREYLAERLSEARAPLGSNGGTLIGALTGPDRTLERSETLANLLIVLFGGIETTESMIGNALFHLLQQPGAREQVWACRESGAAFAAAIEGVTEESLRFEPAVQTLTRHATGDIELGGQEIAEGDTVQCMVGGANRDPAVFDAPDDFDIDRDNVRRHLSFGLGGHFCLGAQLARAETFSALTNLLERFPDLELDADAVLGPHGHEFRKPLRLPARLRS